MSYWYSFKRTSTLYSLHHKTRKHSIILILPAFIIFKASENGRIARESFDDTYIQDGSIYYAVQDKAWIDTRTYQDWVTRVLVPFQASQWLIVDEGNLYLLQDMCMVHLKSDNLEALSAVGIQADFIPAGYTGCL